MRLTQRALQSLAMKRKAQRTTNGSQRKKREKKEVIEGSFHSISREEQASIQTGLLEWYDAKKRDLPWRQQSTASDINQRAYAVWVSEIMLQQTQVATVVDYYKRWMKKWPSLETLAQAKLEEVNEMWSGLGYYSRARRLHEGAHKVVTELHGEMPRSCEDLQKQLPGVGRYTAGAIASIALRQKCGVVDGNVIRVLSRLRMIGAESAAQLTMDTFWTLANQLADCERPGDLNQGLMELGATVCSPKSPMCSACPVSQHCKAFTRVEKEKKRSAGRLLSKDQLSEIPDIECLTEDCSLCLPREDPWDSSLGVQNFPRRGKKKAAREQTSSVYVISKVCQGSQRKFLILQRPEKGLLAGMWEFPTCDLATEDNGHSRDNLQQQLSELGVCISHVQKQSCVGEVVHIFSHIHQTYQVSAVTVEEGAVSVVTDRPVRWLSEEELQTAALPTAMRKVFRLYSNKSCGESKGSKRKGEGAGGDQKKQRSIASFFGPKN